MNKGANERCPKLCSRGCSIYKDRPVDCRVFSCRWLIDSSTADLRRPDKTGYVIDPMLDRIMVEGEPIDVVQVWCDPKRPEAHRDPALRAWLAGIAERYRLPALIRWNSRDALFVAAPSLTHNGEWQEQGSRLTVLEREEMDHRLAARRSETHSKGIPT